jgi:hypothetical protein
MEHVNRTYLLLLSAAVAACPGTAFGQTSGSLFQLGSKKMSSICSSEQNMDAIAADTLGYSASRISKDAETRAVDEFALAAAPNLAFQIRSSKWRADGSDEGRCHLSLVLTLPPAVAFDFGRVAVLSSDVQLRLRRAGNGWSLYSQFGDSGIPANGFRDHLKPYAEANARQRVADFNRMRREAEQDTAITRKRAAAEAEAAFKRDHPREWAAEQERMRLDKERRRKEILAQEAEERRKAEACEANGGTWGYKRHPHSGIRLSENRCYFPTGE